MKRRTFTALLGGAAAAWPIAARAQQPSRIWRVGNAIRLSLAVAMLATDPSANAQAPINAPSVALVMTGRPDTTAPLREAFLRGMHALGHVDGKNLAFTFHSAGGAPARLPEIVRNVVASRVNVIVVSGTPGVLAAKNATQTIPIVMVSVADALDSGLVTSLSRPSGNVTGLSNFNSQLTGKRLELFREFAPGAKRFAILYNPENPSQPMFLREAAAAARALSMEHIALPARNTGEIDLAFQKVRSDGIATLIVADDPSFFNLRQHIADSGARERLSLICGFASMARAGCLFSYGNDIQNDFERAAIYVDKILKGISPSDLPIEQPTKFELVINLKTARELGITIPLTLLVRANEVIE